MSPAYRVGWLGMVCIVIALLPLQHRCLRCHVCGGNSGVPCRDIQKEKTDYAELQDPIQDCNDLINNRGCVKQYVNGVVLLRGCWLDGTNKCLRNGAAEVCTCSKDLCNTASRPLLASLWTLMLTVIVTAALSGQLMRLDPL